MGLLKSKRVYTNMGHGGQVVNDGTFHPPQDREGALIFQKEI